MESRFHCCAAINKALLSSNMLHDASVAEVAAKVCFSSLKYEKLTHLCCQKKKKSVIKVTNYGIRHSCVLRWRRL